MNVSDFDYELPEELIAQDPLEVRSSSRLMVLDKETGAIEHKHFSDIIDYLNPGDCLVLNDTKVIPARLLGIKKDTGAHVEILLLNRKEADVWECLVRPGKKLRNGAVAEFGDRLLEAEITDTLPDGNRLVRFRYEGIFEEVLDRLGEMPLPPYITHKLKDKNRYQTVYAVHEGSAAAPTAGLHFTNELLAAISDKGVNIAKLTLHVGLGTFRPVKAATVEEHEMHSEFYQVSPETADLINNTLTRGGRVVSVGTTSTRTMESAAVINPEYEQLIAEGRKPVIYNGLSMIKLDEEQHYVSKYIIKAGSDDTSIFIYPGYEWRIVEALSTNFHLPQSTLIMLVSALAGYDHIMHAYNEAVSERYRFFSFGDAMLII